MKIGNFVDVAIDVEIMEFGLVLFLKSNTIPREMHSSSTITRSIKSLEEGKNAKFESKLEGRNFECKTYWNYIQCLHVWQKPL
jgi:hypothetical protein